MAWTLGPDSKLLTCAADRTIKLWDPYRTEKNSAPISSWAGSGAFTSLSHHRSRNAFACASSVISIYDLERHNAAPDVLQWPNATETITDVCFNQIETSILGSVANDRSVVLYDLRTSSPVLKTILKFASNRIVFNPMEAMNFATASEDHNVVCVSLPHWMRKRPVSL